VNKLYQTRWAKLLAALTYQYKLESSHLQSPLRFNMQLWGAKRDYCGTELCAAGSFCYYWPDEGLVVVNPSSSSTGELMRVEPGQKLPWLVSSLPEYILHTTGHDDDPLENNEALSDYFGITVDEADSIFTPDADDDEICCIQDLTVPEMQANIADLLQTKCGSDTLAEILDESKKHYRKLVRKFGGPTIPSSGKPKQKS
jgi:hypothetical protein